MESLIITPKTKIHALLEAYPELEETLILAAPPFKKLRNPVLRRTIARVTTLSQAASVGGLKVEELINTLREAAGQQLQDHHEQEGSQYNFETPDWFAVASITLSIDISDMLNAGEQPVHEVLSAIKKLNPGEIIEIRAPFLPAPLIDKATGLGYAHWVNEVAEDDFLVYFKK